MNPTPGRRGRGRLILACIATAALLAPLVWFWQASLMPDSYSVMDMGDPDWGGGPTVATAGDNSNHWHHSPPMPAA